MNGLRRKVGNIIQASGGSLSTLSATPIGQWACCPQTKYLGVSPSVNILLYPTLLPIPLTSTIIIFRSPCVGGFEPRCFHYQRNKCHTVWSGFAGVPDPPHNCSITNRSQSWVHVSCNVGFDGGLPQQFTAEVWRLGVAGSGVVSNSTSRSGPQFTLTSLEPGVAYSVLVYSSNAKGRSGQSVTLETSTLGHTQTHRRTTGIRAFYRFLQNL